ncbi:ATP-binding cassette domain-containing protein [candidate division KSB1 bacterium]|nr:ATP-binding cassette domain-containing protein [candidate division KSB1 bacterium]
MASSVIELSGVNVRFGQRPVLVGLSLVVEKGEMVIVEGVTGSGKTTLMRVLLGAQPLAAGYGKVAGIQLGGVSRVELTSLRRRIGMVFQLPRFLDQETVLTNVSLPLAIAGETSDKCRGEGTRALLDAGLAAAGRKQTQQLSGGEQARLQIARALIHRPLVLLADEPFAHLDPESAAEAEALLSAAHARGTTVLVTTHRQTNLAQIARRLQLDEGRLK